MLELCSVRLSCGHPEVTGRREVGFYPRNRKFSGEGWTIEQPLNVVVSARCRVKKVTRG